MKARAQDQGPSRESCERNHPVKLGGRASFPGCRGSVARPVALAAHTRSNARPGTPPHPPQRVRPVRRRTHPAKRLRSFRSSSPYPLFSRSSACNSTVSSSLPASPRSASTRLPVGSSSSAPVGPLSGTPDSNSGAATRFSRLTSPISSPRSTPRQAGESPRPVLPYIA